jgi:hypothetical protein
VPGKQFGAGLHQQPDRRRRGVPDIDPLAFENVDPAQWVEVGLIDDAGGADDQRRDDAVRGAGHPTRIGRAPEHVIRMQVEGDPRRGVVRQDGAVDVDGPLRQAGRAAGEMQQGRVFGASWHQRRGFRGGAQQGMQVQGVRNDAGAEIVDQQDMPEGGEFGAQCGDFALIGAGRRHQHFAVRLSDAAANRLGSEGLKKRRDHGADLERTEYGDVKLADAAAQHENAVPFLHVQRFEGVPEAVSQAGEFAIADVAGAAIRPQKPEGSFLGTGGTGMAVDSQMGNVDGAIGGFAKLAADQCP